MDATSAEIQKLRSYLIRKKSAEERANILDLNGIIEKYKLKQNFLEWMKEKSWCQLFSQLKANLSILNRHIYKMKIFWQI